MGLESSLTAFTDPHFVMVSRVTQVNGPRDDTILYLKISRHEDSQDSDSLKMRVFRDRVWSESKCGITQNWVKIKCRYYHAQKKSKVCATCVIFSSHDVVFLPLVQL